MRFLVPLKLEAMPVQSGAGKIKVERIGMGQGRALRATERILAETSSRELLVLLGVAGGLSADDRPGQIVVASSLERLDSGEVVDLPGAKSVTECLFRERIDVREGRVVTATKIVHGASGRSDAAKNGALAVDMESYWCVPLLARHLFVVVRVLFDVPGQKLRSRSALSATREAYRSLRTVARTLATFTPASLDIYPLKEVGES